MPPIKAPASRAHSKSSARSKAGWCITTFPMWGWGGVGKEIRTPINREQVSKSELRKHSRAGEARSRDSAAGSSRAHPIPPDTAQYRQIPPNTGIEDISRDGVSAKATAGSRRVKASQASRLGRAPNAFGVELFLLVGRSLPRRPKIAFCVLCALRPERLRGCVRIESPPNRAKSSQIQPSKVPHQPIAKIPGVLTGKFCRVGGVRNQGNQAESN